MADINKMNCVVAAVTEVVKLLEAYTEACSQPSVALNPSFYPLIMSLTANDEKVEREEKERHEIPFLSMCDWDFKSHFRMDKTTFEKLLVVLGTKEVNVRSGRPPIEIKKAAMLMVWTLANQESFRDVALRFGLERGNAHRVCLRVCEFIVKKRAEFLRWPTEQEMQDIVVGFKNLPQNAFPDVCGCVDGTHIPIKKPREDSSSYYNRKGFHSILLQVIVDGQMKIMDAFVGCPGSTNDANVWNQSPILSDIKNYSIIPKNCHIVGDSAYPLSTYLMTPYRDNGSLNEVKRNFNKKLSSVRLVVEQAYGLLKGRFRRMKYLDVATPATASTMVLTACCLHNLCLETSDLVDFEVGDGSEESADITGTNDMGASHKRDLIAEKIMFL